MTCAPVEREVVEGFGVDDIKPLPHHILIRWPGKQETKGGILLPEDRERAGRMNGVILAIGPECDKRLAVGQSVQFSMHAEKEFLGPQSPGDRDPVFFMREEDLIGILTKDGFKVTIELLNGCVLCKPEIKPEEKSGLLIVDREGKREGNTWGTVLQLDTEKDNDFKVGDVVLYKKNMAGALGDSPVCAEEFRLGDFSEDVLHIIRQSHGCDVMAVREGA